MKERASLLPPLKVGLLALAGTLLLAGCLQERAHYDVGLSTREISGDVDLGPPPEPPGPVLVLVLLYHYKFVQLEGDPVITHPTAQLAPLRSDGSYL
ncbi:MAG TPA: hypothetical protein VL359_03995, partial [bacterium]|nr:hypothetical protein [bacterium]